ncbi:MAG: glycosyltransferase family 2 protein [Planctomycetota bacterium]
MSVLVPIRNEADFIARCLQSLQASDYPRDRFEILVIDGMSDDGTWEVVAELAATDPRIHLLTNPHRIVPHAMNTGIRAARGEILIRVDGHATVAPDFVRQSVCVLQQHPDAWCVGGPIETVSTTFIGRTIAAAMSTPVGVGNAMFRLGGYEGYVDTIAFGAYWRWVFDRIGFFDEELVRNQDDELNARLIQRGGKIYMSQTIRSWYFPRVNLRKLWRQYYQYGFWRIRTVQKLGRPATLRQMAPLVFVLGVLILLAAALVWGPAVRPLGAYLGVYALGLTAGSVLVGRRAGWRSALLAPVVFAILHFGYGLGSLKGLVWFMLLRRGPARAPAEHALSR